MDRKIKIAAVSYLNTVPFIYGLEHAGGPGMKLLLSPPAGCAEAIARGEADVALIPVAEIPRIPGIRLIGNYCISAVDSVRTVVLASDSPVEEIHTIYLDGHSRTSVELAKILAREKWKITVEWKPLNDYGFVAPLHGVGYVLIGDKVFGYEKTFRHVWDLSHEWYALTGLPFVFAAWVAREGINESFVAEFEAALSYGIGHIPQAAGADGRVDYDTTVDYLTRNIDFRLDEKKRTALDLFFRKLAEEPSGRDRSGKNS